MSNSNNVSSMRALVMLVALIMVSIAVAQMTPPKPCARSSDCGSSTQYCRQPGIHPSLRATPNASRYPSVDDDGSKLTVRVVSNVVGVCDSGSGSLGSCEPIPTICTKEVR